MNFKFLIISVVIMSGFAGSAGGTVTDLHNMYICSSLRTAKEFSQEEIDEMKQKAVLITMHEGTFT